jgi:hypothetical protein
MMGPSTMTLPPGFPLKDKYKFTYALYLMFDKDNNLLAMGHTVAHSLPSGIIVNGSMRS